MVALASFPSVAPARNPGASRAGGNSLGEWIELYWMWAKGGDVASPVGNNVFLPLPSGAPSAEDPSISEGELDVTLRPDQRFVLPVFVFLAEIYLEPGVPDDDPALVPDEVFTGARVLVTLDGKPLIDSEVDDLDEFFFETRFFDETLVYDEPVEYAPDVHAIAATAVKGLGLVHSPLPKGSHTLELFVYSDALGFGYHNTWHITVGKE